MPYPTPPGPRIAYDLDGSRVFVNGMYYDLNTDDRVGPYESHSSFKRVLNSDAPRLAAVPFQFFNPAEPGTSPSYASSPTNMPRGLMVIVQMAVPMRIRALAVVTMMGVTEGRGSATPVGSWLFQSRVETSSDSTNGIDGTWSSLVADLSNDLGSDPWNIYGSGTTDGEVYGFTYPNGSNLSTPDGMRFGIPRVPENYRREQDGEGTLGWRDVAGSASRQVRWLRIVPLSWTGTAPSVLPHQWGMGTKLHLYGEPDTTATEQRLIFTDEAGAWKPSFDWGDVGHDTEHVQSFKVRNLSEVSTAENVTLSVLVSNPSASLDPYTWVSMSADGGDTWDTSILLGDLAPEASSDTILLRVQVGDDRSGPFAPRLSASIEGWS